jgi:hypothetical protein
MALFPSNYTGAIANKIIDCIEIYKIDDAKDIFSKLLQLFIKSGQAYEPFIGIVNSSYELTIDAIRYYIEYQSLPVEQRNAIKEENVSKSFQKVVNYIPATSKQLWKLKRLGYTGDMNLSISAASKLISDMLDNKN